MNKINTGDSSLSKQNKIESSPQKTKSPQKGKTPNQVKMFQRNAAVSAII